MILIELLDGTVIYNGRDRNLINPVLRTALNKGGELSFSIDRDDVGYDRIYPKITMLDVVEEHDGERTILWSGRVDTVNVSSIYSTKRVTCVGVLSLLYDWFSILDAPSDTEAVSVESFFEAVADSHNRAMTCIGNMTPITIYAESDSFLSGQMYIYWQHATDWKRGILPVHVPGAIWSYFGAPYHGSYYLRYVGPEPSVNVRIRAASHGTGEMSMQSYPTTATWKASPTENTVLDVHGAVVKKAYFHDFTYLTMTSGQLYRIDMYSDLLKLSSNMDIEPSPVQRGIEFPYDKSLAKTLEYIRYITAKVGGYVTAVRDPENKMIKLRYTPNGTRINQSVQLRKNLIEYSENHSYDDLFTGIILYEDGEDGGIKLDNRTGIAPDIYVSDVLSRAYGPILTMVQKDESFDPQNPAAFINKILATAEKDYLSLTVKMVDEADFNPDLNRVQPGSIVSIRTLDTEIEEVCTGKDTYLNEPEKNVFQFGVSPRRLQSFLNDQEPDIYAVE